jgi:hypothetical protein
VAAGGELVKVARARHQAEAELIEDLLRQEGIPSLSRRAGGFDVPDFLAAGPRDVLVPASAAEAAREILGEVAPAEPPPSTLHGTPAWVRALAMTLAVVALVVVAVFVIGGIVS